MKKLLQSCADAIQPLVDMAHAHRNYWGDASMLVVAKDAETQSNITLLDCQIARDVHMALLKRIESI